ncbi:hypothetical protein BGZ97_001703, partial [Linnemannia gamsii]
TPAQQEADRIKRLERTQKRQQHATSSSTPTSTTASSPGGGGGGGGGGGAGRDFLDGFEQSIGLFGGVVKFMSHYVWNAALVMAEYIEAGDVVDIRDKRVIEFGAGAALPGILCVKRGAQFVTLTDYPDPAIVQNLERNWFENLVESVQDKDARRIAGFPSFDTEAYKEIVTSAPFAKGSRRDQEEQRVKCAVRGHAWGENVQEMLECLPSSTQDSEQATGARGVVSDMKNSDRRYDWVLLADTLWVSEGHADLLKSCLAVLRGQGKIFVCCGLHTGYNTVQRFMTLATSPVFGLHSRLVEIRRMPLWGETRSPEELRKENELLKEEDLEQFSVEDRNRTVLVYELWR